VRAIDRSLVDEVWRGLAAYPPGRADAEAKAFLERQPHVAAFCRAVTKQFDERAQKAALGLAFLLFKVLEASLGAPVPSLARERVMEAYSATTGWVAQWGDADPRRFLEGVLGGEASPGLDLSRYLLSVVFAGDPAGAVHDAEVVASLLLMLRTLAGALDICPGSATGRARGGIP